jgi:uncharacterized protein YneF (UPF0154 family)
MGILDIILVVFTLGVGFGGVFFFIKMNQDELNKDEKDK